MFEFYSIRNGRHHVPWLDLSNVHFVMSASFISASQILKVQWPAVVANSYLVTETVLRYHKEK